jgi:hypothetical protein
MILETIIKWGIPFVLTAFIGYIIKEFNDNKNSNKAMKQGLLSIIRSQVVSKCEKYQKDGFLPEYARYCLEDLFKQYKQLGGNHGVEKLVDKTFELPSTKNK